MGYLVVLPKRHGGYYAASEVRNDAAETASAPTMQRTGARVVWVSKASIKAVFSDEEVNANDRTAEVRAVTAVTPTP